MGHECAGVEEIGSGVRTIKPGQLVVGSFFASYNTCEICRAGYQSRCLHAERLDSHDSPVVHKRTAQPSAHRTIYGLPGGQRHHRVITARGSVSRAVFPAVMVSPSRAAGNRSLKVMAKRRSARFRPIGRLVLPVPVG